MTENQPSSSLFIETPTTISPQARAYLHTLPSPEHLPPAPQPDDTKGWAQARTLFEQMQHSLVETSLKRYKSRVSQTTLGGVPVLDIKPRNWRRQDCAVIYCHGGAYTLYSARSTLSLSALLAHRTGLRVFSVDYTLAPQAKWRRATGEVLSVLKTLQHEGFPCSKLAICGDSAGGALAAAAVLRARDQGQEMPAAAVLISPWADISNTGDSSITLKQFEPIYLYEKHLRNAALAYAAARFHRHPYVSPVYANYRKGFAPTLIQGGTRELLLSHFVRLYQRMDQAGVEVKLDLYDGMIHDFQRPLADAPEGRLAWKTISAFLNSHLAVS